MYNIFKSILIAAILSSNLFSIDLKEIDSRILNYIKMDTCKLIDRKYYTVCWNFEKNVAESGWTIIDPAYMNTGNINKRSSFYKDKEVQTLSPTQIKNPLHKGHTFAKDEDFDYIQESLKSTYNMINITPMYGKINIGIWRKIENRGRTLAKDFGPIISITKISYTDDSKFGIPAGKYPKEFIRIYIGSNFEECYKSGNDINENNNLLEHKIECKEIK